MDIRPTRILPPLSSPPARVDPRLHEVWDTLDLTAEDTMGSRLEDVLRSDTWEYPIHLFEGDVVGVDLSLSAGLWVFPANVILTGVLADDPDSRSTTVVYESVRTRHCVFGSDVVVGGDVRCEGVVFCSSGSNCTLSVGGDMTASAVIESGHAIVVEGQLRSPHVLLLQNVIEAARVPFSPFAGDIGAVVQSQFLSEGNLDESSLKRALRNGEDPLVRSADSP